MTFKFCISTPQSVKYIGLRQFHIPNPNYISHRPFTSPAIHQTTLLCCQGAPSLQRSPGRHPRLRHEPPSSTRLSQTEPSANVRDSPSSHALAIAGPIKLTQIRRSWRCRDERMTLFLTKFTYYNIFLSAIIV